MESEIVKKKGSFNKETREGKIRINLPVFLRHLNDCLLRHTQTKHSQ
jgi:hypothetical protein